MLLENKTAVIYGGAGSIGGAVARAFAREGAGCSSRAARRRRSTRWPGRSASAGAGPRRRRWTRSTRRAVDEHADAVAAEAGGIDISFNLIAHPYTQGPPSPRWRSTISWRRWQTAARTTFLTAGRRRAT